jgi:hypothetical protein
MQILASSFAARDQLLAMTDDDAVSMSRPLVRHLTAPHLLRCPALPLDWAEQRRMLGFPAI